MKKIVFIVGTGHCGSTLLDLILSSHPDTFGLGELYKLKYISDYYNNKVPFCNINDNYEKFWNDEIKSRILQIVRKKKRLNKYIDKYLPSVGNFLEKRSRKKLYQYLFEISGKNILIDSSKYPKWIVPSLEAIHQMKDVTPYIIYISRDGRASINSYKRKHQDRTIETIAKNWVRTIEEINAFLKNYKGKKHWLKYENLALHPEKSIRDICAFISIDYHTEMLKFWEKEHHHIGGNEGTKSLVSKFTNNQLITHNYDNKEYYGKHEMGIRLDERWRRELSAEQLHIIEEIINGLNKDIAHN